MGIFKPNFRDTRPHNEGDMEYFKKMLKGTGYPDPPPPHRPLNRAFLFGDLLKRKKNPRGVVSVEEEGKS